MRKNVCCLHPLDDLFLIAGRVLQKPLLPVTVQDQIRLWELERNRIKAQDGTLSGFFPTL